jgi:23S rRNA (pseudouridine1915-N3)-methyltransferase
VRLRVIAVGTRMPAWVRTACDDYLARLSGALAGSLTEITPGPRPAGSPVQAAMALEGRRLLAALQPGDHVVALDERGRELSTRELAAWLGTRLQQGQDLAFLIGGPDGLAPEVLERSHFTLSLSRLTLPHALVRVLLSEQLYRAHCILTHHPYHRD